MMIKVLIVGDARYDRDNQVNDQQAKVFCNSLRFFNLGKFVVGSKSFV